MNALNTPALKARFNRQTADVLESRLQRAQQNAKNRGALPQARHGESVRRRTGIDQRRWRERDFAGMLAAAA
jgi:hypothetical protein